MHKHMIKGAAFSLLASALFAATAHADGGITFAGWGGALQDAERKLAAALPYAKRGKAVNQVAVVRTGRDPGVTVGVRFGTHRSTNARLANSKGLIRHPVFADGELTRKEWRWVNQPVPGAQGWFDRTYQGAAPEIRRSIEAAMQDTVNRIVADARGRGL